MLKTPHKSVLVVLLLMFFCGNLAHAETKLYRYDGKLPFVQMMLNMMVAMGILDRLPRNAAYGGFSNYSNPYARALAMRGLSPGLVSGLGSTPFSRSPWLQSPWSSSALNNSYLSGASPVWGSPSWGVLPIDSYTTNNYPVYDYPGSSSVWSSADLDGWVNEPWEVSEWNPRAESSEQTESSQATQPSVPLVQNFNYNMPEKTQQDTQQGNNRANRQSPLARLAQPGKQTGQQTRPQTRQADRPPLTQKKKRSPLHKKSRRTPEQYPRQYPRQKPCITDFCGLKKPDMNGLWVAQNGEMLGINNQRYLWTDNQQRYLTGKIKIQNEYLLTSVEGHEKIMRFKYKLAGDHLLTLKPDGTIREFYRMPVNKYYGQSSGSQYDRYY